MTRPSFGLVRRAPRAAERGFDVVFYMPSIGRMISYADSLPAGGAETQVLILAKELAACGARVAIIAFGGPAELPDDVDGVSIVPRPRHGKHGGLIGNLGEVIQIWRSLRRAPSGAVVARMAGPHLGVIGVYTRLARRRFVYSTASPVDFEPSRYFPERRYLLMHKLGLRLADAVVVQTAEQASLCSAACGRTPVLIKSLSPAAEQRERTPSAFLWVGRLIGYKRPLEYLELARAVPEATFWMVAVPLEHVDGEEQLADEVIARSSTLPNLKLLPPRPHEELVELMWHAVASVNTSDFEGMPNALLEAWSRGVPALVLTCDPGGVVIKHGLGAVANGSQARFAELARELWQSRGDQHALSLRCRRYVADNHSPRELARRWSDVLALSLVGHDLSPATESQTRCAA
jgi:glycosyltransferase involved in cell wall biosynthesis